jgi:hypothetical protein
VHVGGENCSDNEEGAPLVVLITDDENDEEKEEEGERDEMLINGSHRLVLCLPLFSFSSSFLYSIII